MENGSVIESAIGWAGKVHLIRSNGKQLRSDLNGPVTLEAVRDSWDKITNMTNSTHFDSIQEVTGALMSSLDDLKDNKTNGNENVDKFTFTDRDLMLYALGGN